MESMDMEMRSQYFLEQERKLLEWPGNVRNRWKRGNYTRYIPPVQLFSHKINKFIHILCDVIAWQSLCTYFVWNIDNCWSLCSQLVWTDCDGLQLLPHLVPSGPKCLCIDISYKIRQNMYNLIYFIRKQPYWRYISCIISPFPGGSWPFRQLPFQFQKVLRPLCVIQVSLTSAWLDYTTYGHFKHRLKRYKSATISQKE